MCSKMRVSPLARSKFTIITASFIILAVDMIQAWNSSKQEQQQIQAQLQLQQFNPSARSETQFVNSTSYQRNQLQTDGGSSTLQSQMGVTNCSNGFLTFELSTGFIYKPASTETLATMPSTLQLTDCLDYCLRNASCLAINFEMGLCVLLASSARQNPLNLYSSQFPVFTIYAEKLCLLSGSEFMAAKQRRKCQRAWSFERVSGFEMKIRPKRKLRASTKEVCMEACLSERDFECRSANWHKSSQDCLLSDQDRHSALRAPGPTSFEPASAHLQQLYGPADGSLPTRPPAIPPGLYQNYYANGASRELRPNLTYSTDSELDIRRLLLSGLQDLQSTEMLSHLDIGDDRPRSKSVGQQQSNSHLNLVEYLENNCIQEPNRLCEFRKLQNKVLKTVDSIYQEVGSLEECKQKCLKSPYRCYSFDYGDTSERVCRTSHLDEASLMSVKDPYLEVSGAVTYELAACFNVTVQCRAKEMLVQVSSSKNFQGRIYAKSRPNSCMNDIQNSLRFELSMGYNDQSCDVKSRYQVRQQEQGVFSNDIVIQHHDRIVTSQDVGLSVYCQYDLSNKSIVSTVNLSVERLEEPVESKNGQSGEIGSNASGSGTQGSSSLGQQSQMQITSLSTTVVKSPNVSMKITTMNGQPVTSATVGDRLALLFEIKEKTSPFGIFVREIVAMDARKPGNHQIFGENGTTTNITSLDQMQQSQNSVLLIDSDGCPTDANIMGQLIRLDPTGRRFLAPFDAFKFPGSELVYFRALISSCVTECKQVVCSGQPAASRPPPTIPILSGGEDESSSLQEVGGSPTTRMVPGLSFDPLAARSTVPFPPTTNALPESMTSTANPPPAGVSLSSVSAMGGLGDALTTVAGFATSVPQIAEAAPEEANKLDNELDYKATPLISNHKPAARPPPRPIQTGTTQAIGDLQLPLVDLLSQDQRDQLIGLFSSMKSRLTSDLRLAQSSHFARKLKGRILDAFLMQLRTLSDQLQETESTSSRLIQGPTFDSSLKFPVMLPESTELGEKFEGDNLDDKRQAHSMRSRLSLIRGNSSSIKQQESAEVNPAEVASAEALINKLDLMIEYIKNPNDDKLAANLGAPSAQISHSGRLVMLKGIDEAEPGRQLDGNRAEAEVGRTEDAVSIRQTSELTQKGAISSVADETSNELNRSHLATNATADNYQPSQFDADKTDSSALATIEASPSNLDSSLSETKPPSSEHLLADGAIDQLMRLSLQHQLEETLGDQAAQLHSQQANLKHLNVTKSAQIGIENANSLSQADNLEQEGRRARRSITRQQEIERRLEQRDQQVSSHLLRSEAPPRVGHVEIYHIERQPRTRRQVSHDPQFDENGELLVQSIKILDRATREQQQRHPPSKGRSIGQNARSQSAESLELDPDGATAPGGGSRLAMSWGPAGMLLLACACFVAVQMLVILIYWLHNSPKKGKSVSHLRLGSSLAAPILNQASSTPAPLIVPSPPARPPCWPNVSEHSNMGPFGWQNFHGRPIQPLGRAQQQRQALQVAPPIGRLAARSAWTQQRRPRSQFQSDIRLGSLHLNL